MRQIVFFITCLFSYMLCEAQATTLTVDNQTPGSLSSKINYGDQKTVEHLIITGYLNQTDLSFIGYLMQKQSLNKSLDLSDAFIVNNAMGSDNDISYDNIFNLQSEVNIGLIALPTSITTPNPGSNVKPLRYIAVDTLVYGSDLCSTYNNALWGYVYSGGSGAAASPKHLVLREGVTAIAAYACDNYEYNSYGGNVSIETVKCPYSMKFIGKDAFRNCNQLCSINLPDNIEEIQELAFENSSYIPDTLKLPESLKIYHTNSFPIKESQIIELGSNVSEFDNRSWSITKTTKVTFIINCATPPIFKKGIKEGSFTSTYSDGKELSGCILLVPKSGYSLYTDPSYDSVGGSSGHWSGWTNPYSHATIKAIPIAVQEILLNHYSKTLDKGSTLSILANILPIDADNKTLIWSSSNANIADVDNNGVVTAISIGTAVITAKSSGNPSVSASCEIIVQQPLEKITLDPSLICIKVGETFENVKVIFYPVSSYNKKVVWTSSDDNVATVDRDGKITARSVGEANITVMSLDNPEIMDNCIVTVIEPVLGITLNKEILEIKEDESEKLIATINPAHATNKSINWNSSDLSIAMVSPDGTVFGIKPGQATIMATTIDGGFVALCKVIVAPQTDPGDPNEPIDSTDPSEPTEPTEPTDPVVSDDPIDNPDPSEPDTPSSTGSVTIYQDEVVDVYTILGTRVRAGVRRPDLSDLPRGIYILRTPSDKTQKVIIN